MRGTSYALPAFEFQSLIMQLHRRPWSSTIEHGAHVLQAHMHKGASEIKKRRRGKQQERRGRSQWKSVGAQARKSTYVYTRMRIGALGTKLGSFNGGRRLRERDRTNEKG
jgi:hypothetical protein